MARAPLFPSPWWWPLVVPHRRELCWGLLATLFCSACASVVPWWAGRAVHALELGQWSLSRHFLAGMMAFTLSAGLGRYLMRQVLIGLSRHIEREQRESLFAFYLARPFPFFEGQHIGDLMNRMGDDVGTIRMALGPGLMSLFQTLSILPVTLFLMFRSSVPLSLAVLAPFLLLALAFYVLGAQGHRLQQALQLVSSRLSTYSHETISGEKVVQAFGLEGVRADGFHELSVHQARLQVRQSAISSAYGPLAGLMGGLAILVLVAMGGRMVLKGALSLGDLTAFTGYLVALAWPIMSLGWSLNLFQRGRAGQERINQILSSPEPSLPPAGPGLRPGPPPALRGRGLVLRFPTGRGLGPVDLEVPAGGSLALVGGIGSGKTLLLQLLAGLRTPQAGSLEVQGRVLEPAGLRQHWAGLGWVPQEALLFSATLRDNICLGAPEAGPEELEAALEAAGLAPLVPRLPQGLDTVVGERGLILSGGERQRAALARALLRRPSLLLMDDALSAVDAETESRILQGLRGHLGRCTLVLATHRIFVAELCERVMVLEEGRVVQCGAPAELAAQEGPYARLKRLQGLERELEGRAAVNPLP